MITVWCVCVGDKYDAEDVRVLQSMVARHLRADHNFWCISDRKRPGVDCVIPDDIAHYPGWWAKVLLLRYGVDGLNLYLDLDTVVVGGLDDLLSDQFSATPNWAQSGHGGLQSSVLAWGGNYSWVADRFRPEILRPSTYHPYGQYGDTDYWGDQDYLASQLGVPGSGMVKAMRGVCSYKYHCRDGRPPDWARVVAFHGEPKPADCSEDWIRCARSSTATAA